MAKTETSATNYSANESSVAMSVFEAKLHRPANLDSAAPWAFVILPKEVSTQLPRRGRMTIKGTIDGHDFQAMLEPDGQLSHWLQLDRQLIKSADVGVGEIASFAIMPVEPEPDPEMPSDFAAALAAAPEARAVWDDTTTIARVDWIHWMTSAKQAKTRAQRIRNACDMLAAGKRRVCCFDPSGFYSKAFAAPRAAD